MSFSALAFHEEIASWAPAQNYHYYCLYADTHRSMHGNRMCVWHEPALYGHEKRFRAQHIRHCSRHTQFTCEPALTTYIIIVMAHTQYPLYARHFIRRNASAPFHSAASFLSRSLFRCTARYLAYIGCISKAKGASSQVEEQITFAHAIWFVKREKKNGIETNGKEHENHSKVKRTKARIQAYFFSTVPHTHLPSREEEIKTTRHCRTRNKRTEAVVRWTEKQEKVKLKAWEAYYASTNNDEMRRGWLKGEDIQKRSKGRQTQLLLDSNNAGKIINFFALYISSFNCGSHTHHSRIVIQLNKNFYSCQLRAHHFRMKTCFWSRRDPVPWRTL